MEQKGQYLGVWLYDEAARLFLNLPKRTAEQRESRWLVLGFVEGEAPIGLWLVVNKIEERTPDGQRIAKTWAATPKTCLIRWDFIIHAQLFGEHVEEVKAGFHPIDAGPRAR